MNWHIIYSRYVILTAPLVALVVLTLSSNVQLWLNACAVLLVSVMFVADRQRHYPVLIWSIGFNWLGIAAAILSADLVGIDLANDDIGSFRVQAVNYNMVALVCFAAGVAFSIRIGGGLRRLSHSRLPRPDELTVTTRNGVIAYFASLAIAEITGHVVANIPVLQQPLIVLYMLKFVCIYLLATAVFIRGGGYAWLVIILCVEVVNGMTSFFGTFKEAFFLALIALVAVGRRPSPRMWLFGAVSATAVIVLSLMWTAVKPEYRRWVSGYTGEQKIVRTFDERLGWMADNLFNRDIDYWKSLRNMVSRIDSTTVFAQYLAWEDAGAEVRLPGRYAAGIQHVLMPRIFFPDKPALDDSLITSAMTGRVIDKDTSISIGYLAEAYYDFGRWFMFAPILIIGILVGAAGRYFMTRDAPYLVRQAFAAAGLFSFFQFATNIDKAFGTFVVGFLVLALVLRFGYPLVAPWLAGASRHPKAGTMAGLTGAE